MKKAIFLLFAVLSLCPMEGMAQGVPVSLMPNPCPTFVDNQGRPLAGGKVFTYSAGSSNPLAVYVDPAGTIRHQNPIVLNASGRPMYPSGSACGIWLGLASYRIVVQNSAGVQIFAVDGVSDAGFFYTTKAVLLAPSGNALQTITGPLAATYFQGTSQHTTSPGLRVGILDPATTLDTASNPPVLIITQPAASGQSYQIPDPQTRVSNFVLNPGPGDWSANHAYNAGDQITPYTNNPCNFSFSANADGTSGSSSPIWSTSDCTLQTARITESTGLVWTNLGNVSASNTLDCTMTGLNCKRRAWIWLEGAGCNNATAGLGWDTFGTNSPTPLCDTGTNVQKGVLAFPSAATPTAAASCTGVGASTCAITLPAVVAHALQEVECAVDGGKTVSSGSPPTDGTNAYTKAVSKTNGNLDLEIWYFNGDTVPVGAGGTLTVTLSASANSACRWRQYDNIKVASMLDRTASNSGTGTAVTSGNTLSTSQNIELVLAAVASASNPTITPQDGFSGHTAVSQATNLTVYSEGKIQQTAGIQSGAFTLSGSQDWASAVATFIVNADSNCQGPLRLCYNTAAQRHVALPDWFLPNERINGKMKWRTTQTPTGTVNVKFGATIACTADGSSDDPGYNPSTEAVTPVSNTPSVITTTAFNSLNKTGCAPGSLLHYQVYRMRYAADDSFEGWVYMLGASLDFGQSQ